MAFAEHRRAFHDYEILETLDAGMELLGTEVKAIRGGSARIDGGRVIVRGGEAFVIGITIPPFQPGNAPSGYEPDRTRRLLLTKKEIEQIAKAEETKGETVIPLRIFAKGPYIKLAVGIARGKKKFDKRETLKKREAERDIARAMKIR